MARDDAEEALVVEDFEYSAAQQRYQVEAQSQRGNNDAMREELFYKDATPKAEHYISFVVRLPPNRRPRKGAAHALADAPLDLELLYAPSAPGEDYVTVPDQGHLKRCEPARRDGDPKGPSERPRLGLVLRYRIELGSYRQGDRRFVRIEARLGTAVPEMDGLDPEEADVLQHLVANAPGDGADLFAPFYPSDGTPWADMMSTMGSGLDGVPHSLANTQEDS
ncbi:hypothetical protein JL720_92 [Aureococcus anophagefferens]|nr:hypothetical protein JL720_92 [Aureococcus anophagefferens]